MYGLIEFTRSKEVAVIPLLWMVEKNECLYPTHKSSAQLKKSVESREQPSASWLRYDVRILKETSKTSVIAF